MKVKARGNGDGSIFQLPNKRWVAQLTIVDNASGAQKYRTKQAANKTAVKLALDALEAGISDPPHKGKAPLLPRSPGGRVRAWHRR